MWSYHRGTAVRESQCKDSRARGRQGQQRHGQHAHGWSVSHPILVKFRCSSQHRWTQNHKGETDWNINTPSQPGLNGREIHVPRGRFLGGSSGCNGTICVRGVKQDYDDWESPKWSGDEMFRAMRKVCGFHAPP